MPHFDPKLPVTVTCDASSRGIGACIMQEHANGHMRPVALASRSLFKAEQNYSMVDKEALAIYFGVKKFTYYLLGRHFTLKTDHKPLIAIFGNKKGIPPMAAGRLQRWNVFLSNYTFDIQHIKGTTNHTADFLSRSPATGPTDEKEEEASYLNFVNEHCGRIVEAGKVAAESRRDPIVSRIIDYVNKGWPEKTDSEELKPYFTRSVELTTEKGVLMWGYRVIVPEKLRKAVLSELHNAS